MAMIKHPQDILTPVIEFFVGSDVIELERKEDHVEFITSWGYEGQLIKNVFGNWDIKIGDEVVYEIEEELYSILVPANKQRPAASYYSELKHLRESKELKHRSISLVNQIIFSLEFLILNANVILENPVEVSPFYIFNVDDKKFIIGLN